MNNNRNNNNRRRGRGNRNQGGGGGGGGGGNQHNRIDSRARGNLRVADSHQAEAVLLLEVAVHPLVAVVAVVSRLVLHQPLVGCLLGQERYSP